MEEWGCSSAVGEEVKMERECYKCKACYIRAVEDKDSAGLCGGCYRTLRLILDFPDPPPSYEVERNMLLARIQRLEEFVRRLE